MTPVEALLRRRIAQGGPVTVAEFMALCLQHPRHGYYVTRDPLGAAGDFTTAPEISQMFGELAGLALAQAWVDQGRPAAPLMVELGPGRGALAADALRALRAAAPDFAAAARILLVETSPALRAEQARRVPGARWLDRLEDAPEGPLFLVANEFFDALPIRQHVFSGGRWRERVLGLAGDALAWGLGSAAPGPADAPEGAVRERCEAALSIAAGIAARIARDGGAALIVDYGHEGGGAPGGDTLQAVSRHRPVDPLAAPGEADLTAHVDFASLAAAARGAGAAATRARPQGDWLRALGIDARAAALARARPDEAGAVAAALRRLTDPAEMGTLFKAMAIHPKGAPPPPGFEETPC